MCVKPDMYQELHHPGEVAAFQAAPDTGVQQPVPPISGGIRVRQGVQTVHIHAMRIPIRIPGLIPQT